MNGKAITAFATALIFLSPAGPRRMNGANPQRFATLSSRGVQDRGAPDSGNRTAVRLFQTGRYMEAARLFRAAHREALARKDYAKAVSSMNDLAGCYFATFQYREAMRCYLEGKRLAQAGDTRGHLPGLLANISSLYLQLGEVRAAEHAAEESLGSLAAGAAPQYRPLLLFQLGQVYFRAGKQDRGARMYREGIEEAAQRGDVEAQARGWDRYGWELLFVRDLDGAERALCEAFRLRRLQHSSSIALSYPKLGLLRLAQGDLPSAEVLLERAVQASRLAANTIPPWSVYHARGQLRMAQGRTSEALDDFRAALALARRWKLEVLPANAVRIAAGVGMEQICSSLVCAGNRIHAARPSRALAGETLAAAEENRAWALRMVLAIGSRMETAFPQEYWETLTRLQRADAAYLATGRPEANRQAEYLRARLTEMETHAGLSGTASKQPAAAAESSLLTRLQRALSGTHALFIFHTDETESWAWGVTNSCFGLYKVPGRDALRPLVLQLREGVLRNSPDAPILGGKLYRALFAGAPKVALAKRDWIVIADDVLHHVPLAALVTGRDERNPKYLIEKHSLRSVPAASLIGQASTATIGNRFVGIGDAVFNTADPRWHGTSEASSAHGWRWAWLSWLPHFHARANDAEALAKPTLQLARLAGSLNEIRACACAWGRPCEETVLLTGTDASPVRLQHELARRPGIVHIATHVVRSRESPDRVGLALSINTQGHVELLTPEIIAAWRYPVGLVVLSACSSGSQPGGGDAARLVRATEYSVHTGTGVRLALPGEGIAGLSRAWLAAGAEATATSLWPTPDDTGQLFRTFYLSLRGPAGPGVSVKAARALRKAQLEMLHSASWRSQPRYWAAFVITGKE